ncbi:hypothetical protein ROZALSC1DRAFT_22928 [Rozella allomycis CSF55]|uniref:Uncharacterized protein n=1 Tax=Rozella allomycis (strain CSF55) TaxID=988480 RepID=A0A4P9YHC9_ROZAC|nr:hypothetical protein ROZALSC1DRAFT_22928 [Rozella allomycis CSF55]
MLNLNGIRSTIFGCIHELPFTFSVVTVADPCVVTHGESIFNVLLGNTFECAVSVITQNVSNGDAQLDIQGAVETSCQLTVVCNGLNITKSCKIWRGKVNKIPERGNKRRHKNVNESIHPQPMRREVPEKVAVKIDQVEEISAERKESMRQLTDEQLDMLTSSTLLDEQDRKKLQILLKTKISIHIFMHVSIRAYAAFNLLVTKAGRRDCDAEKEIVLEYFERAYANPWFVLRKRNGALRMILGVFPVE